MDDYLKQHSRKASFGMKREYFSHGGMLFIAFTMLLITFSCNVYSQKLWELKPNIQYYVSVQDDTTRENLRQLVIQEQTIYAALLLAFQYGEQEKEFVLNRLRNWAYKEPLPLGISPYYYYQKARGYYGEQGAIQGMDTLIKCCGGNPYRLAAINLLAEAGIFSYFDTVLNAYNRGGYDKSDAIEIFGKYGKDQNYSTQIRTLLEGDIRNSTEYEDYVPPARVLAEFDRPYAITILNELFQLSVGADRFAYFNALEKIDPHGQPERVIWAAPNETDEIQKVKYYPISDSPENGHRTKRYYEPFYIKFAIDQFSVEQSDFVRFYLVEFLNGFRPIIHEVSIPIITLIDSMISYKEQLGSYGWVMDSSFVNEIDNNLSNARNYLLQGDSNNSYHQIKLFQQKVDEEYRDSLDGDTRQVTKEGWKFLYYNAKYILDRLPVDASLYRRED